MRGRRRFGYVLFLPWWVWLGVLFLAFVFWYVVVIGVVAYLAVLATVWMVKRAKAHRADPEAWEAKKAQQKINRKAVHAYWRSGFKNHKEAT